MRPVQKKKPGEIIEYTNSMNKNIFHIIKTKYNPYGDAKEPLIANIGSFCSYSEEYKDLSDIHIEHILPKNTNVAEYEWDNFLLSCCICNSCKGKTIIDLETTHYPHRDNTYLDFIYEESGRVKINPNLPTNEYKKAQNLYNLVKLGRCPSDKETPSKSDYRWRKRFETWNLAKDYLDDYNAGRLCIEHIINMVKSRGHWSIWFTVFKGHNRIRKALIEQIPGTCADCFDEDNNYEPIPRKL